MNTMLIFILFAAIGAWMWWRIARAPHPTPSATPADSPDPDLHPERIDLIDALLNIRPEYTTRTDLEQIVLLNDSITSVDFILHILEDVFEQPLDTAMRVMTLAALVGECIIAVLPSATAAERIVNAQRIAEKADYPLQIVARPMNGLPLFDADERAPWKIHS